MATVKVTPRSLTEAYKRREGDFSPNLVGLQFTDGVSLFTFGNFQITTNLDRKLNKNFVLGGQWSDYYSLDNLNLSQSTSEILLSNEILIRLNFDPYNISRYVYFGSFQEFVRVTIEQIIQKWKGSLFLDPFLNTNTAVNTVLSFNYNGGDNTSTFLIPKSVVSNNFELIIDSNNFLDTEIYNLQLNYDKYVIWTGGDTEYPLIGYTGSTDTYPYIFVKTIGNPFPTLSASTFGQITYHLKPNSLEVQLFFENLLDFEKVLLNRLTTPIYTSSFDVPKESDGVRYVTTENFTWPVSDGYNIDINTTDYAFYVKQLLNAAINFDSNKTDLVSRRFVSESIHEFDTNGGTVGGEGEEAYGMKVSKLLRIYGREFDEVKKYIDGISFANVVTYNKLDNTSDELIKMMAKNLGFDVLLTVGSDNFNLTEQIKPSLNTPFSGYSRSLSAKELDIELWRRLVINAWWLFKSKGTRKVIEFFFNLFKIPQCVISLNEYVYLAENRLDIQKVYTQIQEIFDKTGMGSLNLSDYPIDNFGFPKVLPETTSNYFQMGGFWYNGGNESTIGNNPHIGPYDFGKSYFSQFECFTPNFNQLLTASTLVTVTKNYFNNYNEGTFIFDQNGLPVPYYGTGYATALNNGSVNNVVVNSAGLTYVGGNNAPNYARPSGDTFSMKISFTAGNKNVCNTCTEQLIFGSDGIVYVNTGVRDPLNNPPLTNSLCCKNYWLPTYTNTPVCPKPNELMISVDGLVLDTNTNQTVSQQCCTKAYLGFNVTWDGRNCVIPQTCPNPESVSISFDNVVLDSNTNETVSQQCCTKAYLGFNVTWDGRNCLYVTSTNTGTPIEIGTENVSTLRTYSTNDLFNSYTGGIVIQSNYTCYWCPPENYLQTICSVDDYLSTLTQTQIIQLAVSLGASPNIGSEATYFISNIYEPFFNNYGCLILDNQDNVIKDKGCCELRGGTLTNINGVNYCLKPNPNPCAGSQVYPKTHVWVKPDNTLLPESCCNQNGQYWVSPVDSNNNNITLVSQNGTTTFLDLPGSTFAGSNSYCSSCPNNLIEVVENSSIIIKDSNNNDLLQECCVDYGFNWDLNLQKCTKCPTVVNYGTELNEYQIVNVNGLDLSQQCCEQIGGWFGNAFGEGDKCYSCPGVMIYDSVTGESTINNGYQLIGTTSPIEVTYEGNSLSQQCCTLYHNQFGEAVWDSETNKCLIYNNNIGTPQSVPAQLKLGNTTKCINNQQCLVGIYNTVYGTSNLLAGVVTTLYVQPGQTPLNSPLYLDASLNTLLTPTNLIQISNNFSSPGIYENFIYFEYNNTLYKLDFTSNNPVPSYSLASSYYIFDNLHPYPTPTTECSPLGSNC
jgi:hypothetical protein